MKIIKSKFLDSEAAKKLVLLIGLFVALPVALYFLSQSLIETFGKGGCLASTGGLAWLHLGLPLMVFLRKTVSWQEIFSVGILSASLVGAEFYFNPIFNSPFDLVIFYNTYNFLYLFGIKGLFEAWKRRKTRSFWWAIFLASPLLAVIFLTIIVGFFFLGNCFNH